MTTIENLQVSSALIMEFKDLIKPYDANVTKETQNGNVVFCNVRCPENVIKIMETFAAYSFVTRPGNNPHYHRFAQWKKLAEKNYPTSFAKWMNDKSGKSSTTRSRRK